MAAVPAGRRAARGHPPRRRRSTGAPGRRPRGRAGCWRATGPGRSAVRVLVTGARGMLGGAVARALAARGDDGDGAAAPRRPGCPFREVLADLGDPAAPLAAGARRAGRRRAPRREGRRGRAVAGVRADERRRHPRRARRRPRRRGRPVRARVVAVGRARRGRAGRRAAPARPTPHRARGHYARSKALAERLASRWPATRGSPAVVAVRPHLVWGPGDTQLVGRIVARARAGRLAVVGTGAALIDTTYVDDAVDALVAALDRAPGAARPGPRRVQRRAAARSPSCWRRSAPRPAPRRPGSAVPAPGSPAPPAPSPSRWPLARQRPADDPVPRRAAVDRALVRPAARPAPRSAGHRGSGLDEGFRRLRRAGIA